MKANFFPNNDLSLPLSALGFTLIELIIYVALISLFMGGGIQFVWSIILSQAESYVQQEVSQNLRWAGKRIVHEIRNSSDINSVGLNEICLASLDSTYNPTRFYLSSGRLRMGWGGGSLDCSSITNDEPLTSNQVSVSSLAFEDLSVVEGNTKNIRFTITIESTSPSGRPEWEKSQTYSSSVELRSN